MFSHMPLANPQNRVGISSLSVNDRYCNNESFVFPPEIYQQNEIVVSKQPLWKVAAVT
jgi:hypothetical protein